MDWKKLAWEQAALIKQLQARIAELEAEIATLKKNSSNSSKPPSSDIVKPSKHLTGTPGKKKLKRGAQKGHKQNLRKPFDEKQVDKVVPLDLEACPTCGGKLIPSNEPPKVHQQVELVDKAVSRYGKRLLKKIREMFATIHCRDELSDRTWRRQIQAHASSHFGRDRFHYALRWQKNSSSVKQRYHNRS